MFHSVVQLMVHSCHISLKKTQFGPLGLIFFTDWFDSMSNSDEKLPNFVKNIRVFFSNLVHVLLSGSTNGPQLPHFIKKNSVWSTWIDFFH